MKTLPMILAGMLIAVTSMNVSTAWTESNTSGTTKPARMIDLLPVGSIADLSQRDGRYNIVLLNEDDAEARLQQIRRFKEDPSSSPFQDTFQDPFRGLLVPWKVVSVGVDHVRFEPMEKVPGREEVTWLAVSGSSLRSIKSKQ